MRPLPIDRLSLVSVLIAGAAALSLAACGEEAGEAGTAVGPSVVASTTQLADLADNVAGERADVLGILAANSDPHEYEPRPSDAEALIDADLVLQSGGELDLWLDELVESAGTDAPVIALIESVATIEGAGEPAEEGVDPHWWQDPINAISAVEAIRDAMIDADPEGREDYESNAAAYVGELEALDEQIAECFGSLPGEQRKLVTSHDALGYFADRYGIEVVGATIPALTTQAQPSAGETAELVELIRAEDVEAVFPEVGVSSELEQAIAAETGADIGAELYADTLGPPGSPGATYLRASAANAKALVSGLSGGSSSCDITVP